MSRKYGDIMLNGKSGHRYCFQAWPFGTRFRPLGAVYFVTKRVYNNKNYRRACHEVIYIGETSSMAEPLASPFQLDAFEKRGANCVCVFASTDEAQRKTMVEDLVAAHRPQMQA
jgi:hypothetical protein